MGPPRRGEEGGRNKPAPLSRIDQANRPTRTNNFFGTPAVATVSVLQDAATQDQWGSSSYGQKRPTIEPFGSGPAITRS
jgi:hypothetical protein